MDGGIIWLASYPKSGNTWLRIFLTNYVRNGAEPADINDLDGGPIASARRAFDDAVGVAASDLLPEEIDRYRPAVYLQMAAHSDGPLFLKVHDAYTRNPDGQPLFPQAATRGVVYLIRNPLDVAVSFAHHSGITVDEILPRLCREDFAFASRRDRLHDQLRQRLLSWSGHVRSWVDEPGLNVHVTRYEDMVRAPYPTFTAIVRFAGLPADPARVSKALDFSNFDSLQAAERKVGFRERSARAATFFRSGQVGDWRQVFTAEQATLLVAAHRDVMHRFGYLTPDGIPTF
ncbi:MAG: sulfotransferase domain-containing protein [Chloroflexi bacterium]|nr:sulfotransferase domain-containing protein [Chloroflexota bacterium]MBU1750466.1 sulfotransferase domain-containing protein [Chloroflexota bacterium]MBU1879960.1 sulfotransferase domain-containing protein [Chloroflexota bacterium]